MRHGPRSLARRILAVEAVAIIVAVIVLPLGAASLLHTAIDIQQQNLLIAQANRIAQGLVLHGDSVDVRLTPDFAKIFANGYDGRAYEIVDRESLVRARSPGGMLVPMSAIPRAASNRLFHVQTFVAISSPISLGGQTFWIIVSQNEARPGAIVDDVARYFLWQYALALMAILTLVPIVSALSIRRLVRDVGDVAEQAAKIGPDTPGHRLNEADLPSEIIELVRATNRLVDRLEFSITQQRQFIANLSHELKTPLATLKVQLDGLTDPHAKAQIAATLDRLANVTSQMRDLAELETLDRTARVPVDLADLAARSVSELAPLVYEERHEIELVSDCQPVLVLGNRLLIELALRNLIVNAVQHTPDGTKVMVAISSDGTMSVSDDGPGLPAELGSGMITRFRRGDRQRADNAGLGLSIVARICEVHDARFELRSGTGRGADFSIHFERC